MLINVQLEEGAEITQMDEADLVRIDGVIDNEVERTEWVEYRLKSGNDTQRIVHRSVNMHLKTGLFAGLEQGTF